MAQGGSKPKDLSKLTSSTSTAKTESMDETDDYV